MPDTITDWRHEARTLLSAGFGQAESARKLGVPIERLKKWAQRAGIRTSLVPSVSLPAALKRVPDVPTAAAIIADEVSINGSDARVYASRIGARVLRHHAEIADSQPEVASARIDEAVGAGRLLTQANVTHWERQPTSTENHAHLHLHQAVRPESP